MLHQSHHELASSSWLLPASPTAHQPLEQTLGAHPPASTAAQQSHPELTSRSWLLLPSFIASARIPLIAHRRQRLGSPHGQPRFPLASTPGPHLPDLHMFHQSHPELTSSSWLPLPPSWLQPRFPPGSPSPAARLLSHLGRAQYTPSPARPLTHLPCCTLIHSRPGATWFSCALQLGFISPTWTCSLVPAASCRHQHPHMSLSSTYPGPSSPCRTRSPSGVSPKASPSSTAPSS